MVSSKQRLRIARLAAALAAFLALAARSGCGFPTRSELEACESDAEIVGTPGPDVLTGTSDDDVIAGLGGDDTIRGVRGDDLTARATATTPSSPGAARIRCRAAPGTTASKVTAASTSSTTSCRPGRWRWTWQRGRRAGGAPIR
jgi:hypothetical protein